MIYSRRPIVKAEAAEALMVRSLGSGANGIGYYMYHGGSTPKQNNGVGFLSDELMGVPKISYDFQAPIGEFGLVRDSYQNLRILSWKTSVHPWLRWRLFCPKGTTG
jgi:beta-galactosidase